MRPLKLKMNNKEHKEKNAPQDSGVQMDLNFKYSELTAESQK